MRKRWVRPSSGQEAEKDSRVAQETNEEASGFELNLSGRDVVRYKQRRLS